MHHLPVLSRNHLNCIPGTAIQEGAIGAFADALLTANAQIWIDFDATEGRMIFVRHPEHAGFDGAVLDACGRAGASGATVSGNREYARLLFARGFAVTD